MNMVRQWMSMYEGNDNEHERQWMSTYEGNDNEHGTSVDEHV